jgi:hypothetical protein
LRLGALLFIPALLTAEQVQYGTVAATVIESRLKLASGDNAARAEVLERLFRDAGCEHLAEQTVSKKGQPNIICTMPGEAETIILVGAHFDTLSPSEGVADNWSGAALLPSLFEALKHTHRKHTFVFIGFTDEEKGLLGSKHYVRKLPKEEKANIIAMVNLDTIGLGPLNVWASHADKELTGFLIAASKTLKMPLTSIEIAGAGSTDSESFAGTKIRRIAISSVTRDNFRILHSMDDRIDVMNLPEYYNSYRVLSLYLAFLDQKL